MKKFNELTGINTANVKTKEMIEGSKVLDSGAYAGKVQEISFSTSQTSKAIGFTMIVEIPSEDKTIFGKQVNFVKKDGTTPNDIGMSALKSNLRAVSADWNVESTDFIGEAEVEELNKLTKDKKPYTVNEFISAKDAEVAILVRKIEEIDDNGAKRTYNEVFSIAHLDDEETISSFKKMIEDKPVLNRKPAADRSSGTMKTDAKSGNAKSATSKL